MQTVESITISEKTQEEKADNLRTREIDYFITEVLPTYPVMAEQISNETVTNVFVFGLDINELPGRLIETKGQMGNSYYLVSDTVQTKLEGVTIDFEGSVINCTVSQVLTVGNEKTLGRKLADSSGYLIIESEQCDTFGGGESVAVFALSTGQKIRLNGNITFDNIATSPKKQALNSAGLALGKLKGVYGYSNPIVAVGYGSHEGYGALDGVGAGAIAFFDLQTGRRVGLQAFN